MRLSPRPRLARTLHARGLQPSMHLSPRAISSSSDSSAHCIPSRPDRGPNGGKPVAKLQRRSEGETMSIGSTESSHPSLSHADGLAASTADAFLLVGRVLLGWLFLASSAGIGGKLWNHAGFLGYLKNLGAPAPEVSSWVGALVEFVIGLSLVLGVGTRYAALLCALFLIAATALAHRYWEFQPRRWGTSTITSSRMLPSSAARSSCSWPGQAASASIGCCRRKVERLHIAAIKRRCFRPSLW